MVQRKRTEPGQESVWDYPRPPRLEPTRSLIRVVFGGQVIAESVGGFRVLETSHPPVFYFPPQSVRTEHLEPASGSSFCEFKGMASYWSLSVGDRRARRAAWSYPSPAPAFRQIRDHFAFYAPLVDACFVDGERVQPQPGDFYGGWITSKVVGPFKGPPGTGGW